MLSYSFLKNENNISDLQQQQENILFRHFTSAYEVGYIFTLLKFQRTLHTYILFKRRNGKIRKKILRPLHCIVLGVHKKASPARVWGLVSEEERERERKKDAVKGFGHSWRWGSLQLLTLIDLDPYGGPNLVLGSGSNSSNGSFSIIICWEST